ncbi:ABC transporter substrate-binding protein [Sodalinema gerasimenkoae]|uniref:ABC transporter substrate-binding protein n=1 Tax=Sodalinema gerasimenkoae TaxID=2862348 RepID=UPI001356FDCA|nr:ABC transporter substrate-binding protein [Sodalinema gerasimenkoae]
MMILKSIWRSFRHSWHSLWQKRVFYGAIALVTAVLVFGIHRIVLSQQPVTVSVLIQALERAQWEPIVERFEEENPDIRLEIIEGPNATNLVEDLYTSAFLLGDSIYDLVYMDIVWTPKFAAAGWLDPLDDRVSEEELSEFLDGDVEGGRFNGELYRMPFRSDAGMLYYRTDLLEENGFDPPETTEELLEIARSLQEQGAVEWGYVWQGRQYEGLAAVFVEILEGHGGFWVNPETEEVGLDDPEAIAALEFLTQTIDDGISPRGVTTYQEEEARRFFQNGRTVFMRNWPYVWPLANEDNSAVQGKIAIQPMVHAAGFSPGACQGGWGLALAKDSSHKEEAWRVIEFMTSESAQKEFVLDTGYVPSRRSLFNDPEIVEKYSHYPDLLEVQEQSVLRPPIAQYAQASDILQRNISSALTGRLSPQQAMERAAAETRRLLGRG